MAEKRVMPYGSWPSPISAADVAAASVRYGGDDGGDVYAFCYAPTHAEITGPEGVCPPLLVISHGGPTGSTSTALNLNIQFWTSCGFAVLDVNYRGSTGYGRAYRDQLAGQWGILDVSDCVRVGLSRRFLCRCELLRCVRSGGPCAHDS